MELPSLPRSKGLDRSEEKEERETECVMILEVGKGEQEHREWSNSQNSSSLLSLSSGTPSSKKVRIKFDQYEHFAGRSRAPEGAERVWWIENGKMSMD